MLEEEIAAIPEISLIDITGGRLRVGLFAEALDLVPPAGVDRRALGDIAVIRRRPRRLDAERHDVALPGSERCDPAGLGELVRLLDHMIGGHPEPDRIGVMLRRVASGDPDRSRGIAPTA